MSAVKLKGLSSVRRGYTTVESWRNYVHRLVPTRPAQLTKAEWQALTPGARATYDEERRIFHRQFPPLATPPMRMARSQILPQVWDNVHGGDGALPGGAIDGHATLGKTTMLAEVGRTFELEFHQKHPAEDPAEQHLSIPVVYVTLPARTTPKGFNLRLANFYNLPLPKRLGGVTTDQLSDAVWQAVEDHQTHLILIDDVHYLQLRDRNRQRADAARTANEHLKYLANELPATFVYAGINLESSGVFDDGGLLDLPSAQTGGRFLHCEVERFSADGKEWISLLKALESNLVLLELPRGTLVTLADYLFTRTQGSIGALVTLVRKTANLAVGRNETITKKLLDQVKTDRNSQMLADVELYGQAHK